MKVYEIRDMETEIRLRVDHQQPDKNTLVTIKPKSMWNLINTRIIPIEQRVFFWNDKDAKIAGYKKK